MTETFETVYATDDGVGILYEDGIPIEVVADKPAGSDGSSAHRVEKVSGVVEETRLNLGIL